MVHLDHQAQKEIRDTLVHLVSSDCPVKEDSLVYPVKRENVVLLVRSALKVLQENRENVVFRESWVLLDLQVSPLKEETLDHLVPPVNPVLLV